MEDDNEFEDVRDELGNDKTMLVPVVAQALHDIDGLEAAGEQVSRKEKQQLGDNLCRLLTDTSTNTARQVIGVKKQIGDTNLWYDSEMHESTTSAL